MIYEANLLINKKKQNVVNSWSFRIKKIFHTTEQNTFGKL